MGASLLPVFVIIWLSALLFNDTAVERAAGLFFIPLEKKLLAISCARSAVITCACAFANDIAAHMVIANVRRKNLMMICFILSFICPWNNILQN